MVEIVGHSQTKGRDNRKPKLRPKPARQSSTLPRRAWGWDSPALLDEFSFPPARSLRVAEHHGLDLVYVDETDHKPFVLLLGPDALIARA
jgi:hypothetical protein